MSSEKHGIPENCILRPSQVRQAIAGSANVYSEENMQNGKHLTKRKKSQDKN